MANAKSDDDVFAIVENIIEDGETVQAAPSGWRIERNSNGRYRWRWQRKSPSGQPITYKTKTGKTAYARGSQYVPKNARIIRGITTS